MSIVVDAVFVNVLKHMICLYPRPCNGRCGALALSSCRSFSPVCEGMVRVIPGVSYPVGVWCEMVRVRHGAYSICDIRDGRPVLSVCSGVSFVGRLSEDIDGDVCPHKMYLIGSILNEALYRLHHRLFIHVMIVNAVCHRLHAVGETDIVEARPSTDRAGWWDCST